MARVSLYVSFFVSILRVTSSHSAYAEQAAREDTRRVRALRSHVWLIVTWNNAPSVESLRWHHENLALTPFFAGSLDPCDQESFWRAECKRSWPLMRPGPSAICVGHLWDMAERSKRKLARWRSRQFWGYIRKKMYKSIAEALDVSTGVLFPLNHPANAPLTHEPHENSESILNSRNPLVSRAIDSAHWPTRHWFNNHTAEAIARHFKNDLLWLGY